VSVSVLQLDVVLLLVVVVVLLLPDAAVVAITLPARTTVVIVTETTTAVTVTVVIVRAALTTGKYVAFCMGVVWFAEIFTEIAKLRKIVNVKKAEKTVPMAKTAKVNLPFRAEPRTKLADTAMAVAMESPTPQTHDELDTAE
jgi:hypothetical protein